MMKVFRSSWLVLVLAGLAALGVGFLVEAQPVTSQAGSLAEKESFDSDDLFDFAYYFGLERGNPLYELEGYQADFDGNGRVDEMDLFHFSLHWHRE